MSSYHEDDDFEIANSDPEVEDEEEEVDEEEEEEEEVPDSDGEEVEIKDTDADEDVAEADLDEEEEVDAEEEDDDAEDAEDDEAEDLETDVVAEQASKKNQKVLLSRPPPVEDDDDEDDDDTDENYLQKFNTEINRNYIMNFHPETTIQNYEEIEALTVVIRNKNNLIIDDLHRTCPFLTKYEYARVLGQRAKQINSGAQPFVRVPENIIDGAVIAEMELRQKRVPFIIRRPLPNGGSEYWNLKDLDVISF
jgi:DNA-directed RNA polymerase subunit K/omega